MTKKQIIWLLALSILGNLFYQSASAAAVVGAAGGWYFDEGTGTTTRNDIANLTGTLTNGPVWVNGVNTGGKAIEFDGVDDYVYVTDSNGDAVDYSKVLGFTSSLSFWIKTTQDSSAIGGTDIGWNRPCVIGSEASGTVSDVQWGWISNDGKINMSVGDTKVVTSNNAINDGNWYHVVISRDKDSGEVKIYIDGTLNDTDTAATGALDGLPFSSFGKNTLTSGSGSDKYYEGILDNINVFDRVLTPAEITALYERRPETADVSVIGHEKLYNVIL